MFSGSAKKRQRVGSSSRLSSYADTGEFKVEDSSLSPALSIRRSITTIIPGGFNDPAASDVLLRLQLEGSPDFSAVSVPEPDLPAAPSLELYLNSSPLHRSRYFAARLSDRWLRHDSSTPAGSSTSAFARLTLKIPNPNNYRRPFDAHVTVLKLLYTLDFTGSILSVSDALEMLPVALQLLFDDCIRACVRFIEAVPWTDEEEEGVLNMIPSLREEESRDLLARVFPVAKMSRDDKSTSEEMLYGLILKAIHSNPRLATVKAFVAKLLRDYSSRESVQTVLDRAFRESLGMVKELLGEYASPDFRVAGDNDETEAIQRLKLHAAMVNARNLFWLVERMLELGVADTAAKEWCDQPALTTDLQKTFREDAWRNIAPGLPSLVLRCTSKLANAMAMGLILAHRQVRMELVRQWLPVLNICREIVPPVPSNGLKILYQDLEEAFLQIISTLPISDAHDLLQQCLCFSTRNVEDCPHLTLAFSTWFRRANRRPFDGPPS